MNASTKRRFIEGSAINVIAVLVVAFMVFDGFFALKADSREKARQLACASNMKVLGLALIQYTQDYDQKAPPGIAAERIGSAKALAGAGWAEQLWPYVKSDAGFACQDDHTQAQTGKDFRPLVSYGFNSNMAQNPSTAGWLAPAKSVELFEVSGDRSTLEGVPFRITGSHDQLSAAGDGTTVQLTDGHVSPSTVQLATGKIGRRPAIENCLPRHRMGADYLFADGHVKWELPTWVSSGSNAATPSADQTGAASGSAAGTSNSQFAATFSTK